MLITILLLLGSSQSLWKNEVNSVPLKYAGTVGAIGAGVLGAGIAWGATAAGETGDMKSSSSQHPEWGWHGSLQFSSLQCILVTPPKQHLSHTASNTPRCTWQVLQRGSVESPMSVRLINDLAVVCSFCWLSYLGDKLEEHLLERGSWQRPQRGTWPPGRLRRGPWWRRRLKWWGITILHE